MPTSTQCHAWMGTGAHTASSSNSSSSGGTVTATANTTTSAATVTVSSPPDTHSSAYQHMSIAIRLNSAIHRVPARLTSIGRLANSIGQQAEWESAMIESGEEDRIRDWEAKHHKADLEEDVDGDVDVDVNVAGPSISLPTRNSSRIRLTNPIGSRLVDMCFGASNRVATERTLPGPSAWTRFGQRKITIKFNTPQSHSHSHCAPQHDDQSHRDSGSGTHSGCVLPIVPSTSCASDSGSMECAQPTGTGTGTGAVSETPTVVTVLNGDTHSDADDNDNDNDNANGTNVGDVGDSDHAAAHSDRHCHADVDGDPHDGADTGATVTGSGSGSGSTTTSALSLSDSHSHSAGVSVSESVSEIAFSGEIDTVPQSLLSQLWHRAHSALPSSDDVNSLSQPTQPESDRTIRNALTVTPLTVTVTPPSVPRELSLSLGEFEVDPDLMMEIASEWSKKLCPKRVRVEPYKLNVYGPGGKVTIQRDANQDQNQNQRGLVGTALVGLGRNTNDWSAGLKLADSDGDIPWRAAAGSYVLFYPDVSPGDDSMFDSASTGHCGTIEFRVFGDSSQPSHEEVAQVKRRFHRQMESLNFGVAHASHTDSDNSHRIAEIKEERKKAMHALFHTNRAADENPHADSTRSRSESIRAAISVITDQIRSELSQLQTPFGLLLAHRDGVNCENLVGADRLLYECLTAIPEFRLTDFPVMTLYREFHDYKCQFRGPPPQPQQSRIYPLTDAHIEYALRSRHDDEDHSGPVRVTVPEPPTPGLGEVIATDIPFLCMGDLDRVGHKWSWHTIDDHVTDEWINNHDYLHRAIIVTRE